MNASDLIEDLKEMIKKYGDLPVYYNRDTDDAFNDPEEACEIRYAEYEEKTAEEMEEEGIDPDEAVYIEPKILVIY